MPILHFVVVGHENTADGVDIYITYFSVYEIGTSEVP
jgi:hypothetical protein